VEHEREWPLEVVVAELRADVRHLSAELSQLRQELREDIRRLDTKIFQLMLAQLATLATALASLLAALAG
jgi:hypothetical protein